MTADSGEPTVTIRWWAAAKAAAGTGEDRLPAGRLDEMLERACLQRERPASDQLRQVLQRCSFLADEVRVARDALIPPGAVVDVLPPFAGG